LLNPGAGDRAGEEAARTVLNFFETIGFLHGKKVVETETIWHFFVSWLLPYYFASDEVISMVRSRDPNSLTELERLFHAVRRIEESRHPSKDSVHLITPSALKGFLEEEASLELIRKI